MPTLETLEAQITGETGLTRSNFYADKWTATDPSRRLIQQYLITAGAKESKILNSSNYVLANAYRIGENYIRKMNEEGFDRRLNKIPQRRRQFGEKLDLNLIPEEINLLQGIGETPFPSPEKEQNAPENVLAPENITRATEQVLTKALQAATDQLAAASKAEVKAQLAEAIASAKLSDALKVEVKALAETVAANATPRKLEIILPNNPPRILPAEPRHCKFDQILRYLARKQNIYIVGPAGTGKTKLGAQLAEALDKKFYPIAQALTKYDVSGYKSPTGEYIGTLMREAIEFGGLALIDEGDTWAAAALMFLNAPLANGYCAFPDRVVEVHPDFLCIIAANTYGRGADRQYQGRNPLDGASLNRFKFVEVDYDKNLETQLFGSGPWVQYCWKVRQAVETLKLSHIISMRNIQFCLTDAGCGDDPNEIASACLWQNLASDTIAKIKNIAGEPPEAENNVLDFGT